MLAAAVVSRASQGVHPLQNPLPWRIRPTAVSIVPDAASDLASTYCADMRVLVLLRPTVAEKRGGRGSPATAKRWPPAFCRQSRASGVVLTTSRSGIDTTPSRQPAPRWPAVIALPRALIETRIVSVGRPKVPSVITTDWVPLRTGGSNWHMVSPDWRVWTNAPGRTEFEPERTSTFFVSKTPTTAPTATTALTALAIAPKLRSCQSTPRLD